MLPPTDHAKVAETLRVHLGTVSFVQRARLIGREEHETVVLPDICQYLAVARTPGVQRNHVDRRVTLYLSPRATSRVSSAVSRYSLILCQRPIAEDVERVLGAAPAKSTEWCEFIQVAGVEAECRRLASPSSP